MSSEAAVDFVRGQVGQVRCPNCGTELKNALLNLDGADAARVLEQHQQGRCRDAAAAVEGSTVGSVIAEAPAEEAASGKQPAASSPNPTAALEAKIAAEAAQLAADTAALAHDQEADTNDAK